ncbi:heavy metal-associated domain-containing protein [Pediococcus pentosaceus]|uniref:heavy-metal-associated domain-containing protein n=1 Tax=Pediococcus pentosaceus TaxID=1255 RepID=UPI0031648F05
MTKIIMKLDTLTCPSCMTKIEGALNKMDGVKGVKVLFNASKIKAEVESEIKGEALKQTVENLGYTVKDLKTKVSEG